MRTPDGIEPQRPPRTSQIVLPSNQVKPTIYESDADTKAVISQPYKARLDGVRWLLDRGYAVRSDLFEFHGPYLCGTSAEAANRYYLYRHLLWARDVIRVAQIVLIDHHRRNAVCDDGRHYPSDITLECLLSLAGEGSVAYAIVDDDGHASYRIHDRDGAVAAMSPWTPVYQDWFDHNK